MIEVLQKRDLIYQFSKDIKFSVVYAGFDGTAKSLQIGNLTPLSALRHLEAHNIKIIVVLGGATSKIGDPSGKTTTRAQLANDIVEDNIIRIKAQIQKLLPNATIVNNYDWISKVDFMSFLDQIAHYIPVSQIINLKTFAERLDKHQPFTIKEMLYPLLQGYDFLHLFEKYNCSAQIGGQDQWCNLLTGVDLISKKHASESIAITCPLLVDSNGNKMGKSLSGAIYLSKELCSVNQFWQFWRNIDDCLTKICLKRLTMIDLEIIENIYHKDINQAKILLANEITTWVHSKEEAIEAETQAKEIFINNNYDKIKPISISKSLRLFEIISKIKNISNSASKKLIAEGGVLINDIKNNNIQTILTPSVYIIKIGKKSVFKILIN